MRVGLLLPHFGRYADPPRLSSSIARLEEFGFDSVWVRDHVIYRPHAFEDTSTQWIDPFVALSVAAANSTRLMLGTATLIPHRHPIQAAVLLSNLASIAGSERLVVGWGRGNDPDEFSALGLDPSSRGAALEEQIDIIRRLLKGKPVSFYGNHFQFSDVSISVPSKISEVPFLYGGSSPKGLRRTARWFDGLLASRIPRFILAEQIESLRALTAEAQRPPPQVGLVLLVSPAANSPEGIKHLDMAGVYADTRRRFPAHRFETVDDLDGVVVAGSPDRIAEELLAFASIGVTHIVIDLRARFSDWDECVSGLSESVLPQLSDIG